MSKWVKLIDDVLNQNPNLRFEDLCKALKTVGYTQRQPSGGGDHYTFRKPGCSPITIPRQSPLNRVYIKMVAEAVLRELPIDD